MNDSNQPAYSFETAKQLIFDCAMELNYGIENLSKEIIAAKLLNIIEEMDKMNIDKMLKDLKIYGGCSTCIHSDRDKFPLSDYCEYGGCCGGGSGKMKEDKWEYRYDKQ